MRSNYFFNYILPCKEHNGHAIKLLYNEIMFYLKFLHKDEETLVYLALPRSLKSTPATKTQAGMFCLGQSFDKELFSMEKGVAASHARRELSGTFPPHSTPSDPTGKTA